MSTLEAQLWMPATICYITDRHAATVVFVSENARKVIVREDTSTRTDENGMSDSQTYEYTPNPQGREHTFFRNSSGSYGSRRGGIRLRLGSRETYHDYSY